MRLRAFNSNKGKFSMATKVSFVIGFLLFCFHSTEREQNDCFYLNVHLQKVSALNQISNTNGICGLSTRKRINFYCHRNFCPFPQGLQLLVSVRFGGVVQILFCSSKLAITADCFLSPSLFARRS